MKISTRPVNVHDADVISKLVGALFNELQDVVPTEARNLKLEQVKRVLALAPRTCGFLLLESETPIGVIMLSEGCSLYADGVYGLITELYIVPAKRSGGHAKRLNEQAEKLGKERGWSMLEVGAPAQPRWQRSLQFYLKDGFQEIGPRLRKRL